MGDNKKDWRQKARMYLAEAFGGKCTICGYDKTISALDYHHIDKDSKDKALSIAMRNGYAWSKIVEEARKCTIVCCRCHREIHAGITELPEDYAKFNEEYSDIIKLRKKVFDTCTVCGRMKNKLLKYCSSHCANYANKKFDITKEELLELVNTMPYNAIGKMYGVTDSAVKKRCKRLGIDVGDRRGYWQKKTGGYNSTVECHIADVEMEGFESP